MFNLSPGNSYNRPQHSFSVTPDVAMPRSSFQRDYRVRGTFNSGLLVPMFHDLIFPGDTVSLRSQIFARAQPMVYPIMDNIYLDTFYFFVPLRLLWDNWERFNGAQDNPDSSTDFIVPQVNPPETDGYAGGSLYDYFGYPTRVPSTTDAGTGLKTWTHHAFYVRAYNLIRNSWFKDQNLQNDVFFTKGDGPDASTLYTLLRRAKMRDYFTAGLPFAQKGDPVTIALGSAAVGVIAQQPSGLGQPLYRDSATGSPSTSDFVREDGGVKVSGNLSYYDPGDTLTVPLNGVPGPTINALRTAIAYQQILELNARGGTRYQERMLAFFGVRGDDARLQRPEYLNGTYGIMLNTIPIPQTSETATTPQASLAAMGTINHQENGFSKSFTEHGVIIGLMAARAEQGYQQGLDRTHTYKTINDFYVPQLANLGEQPVLQSEIYLTDDSSTTGNSRVFSYMPRWDELRFRQSFVTGLFRSNSVDSSNNPNSLDAYHLVQYYTSAPLLNSDFIEENPPMGRVKAVPGTAEDPTPDFEYDIVHSYRHVRVLPTFANPGLMRF